MSSDIFLTSAVNSVAADPGNSDTGTPGWFQNRGPDCTGGTDLTADFANQVIRDRIGLCNYVLSFDPDFAVSGDINTALREIDARIARHISLCNLVELGGYITPTSFGTAAPTVNTASGTDVYVQTDGTGVPQVVYVDNEAKAPGFGAILKVNGNHFQFDGANWQVVASPLSITQQLAALGSNTLDLDTRLGNAADRVDVVIEANDVGNTGGETRTFTVPGAAATQYAIIHAYEFNQNNTAGGITFSAGTVTLGTTDGGSDQIYRGIINGGSTIQVSAFMGLRRLQLSAVRISA